MQCSSEPSEPNIFLAVEEPDGQWLSLGDAGSGLTSAEYSAMYGRLMRLAKAGRVRSRISVNDRVIATIEGPHVLLDSASGVDVSELRLSPDVYMYPHDETIIVACLSTRSLVRMSPLGVSYLMNPDSAPAGVSAAFFSLGLLVHRNASDEGRPGDWWSLEEALPLIRSRAGTHVGGYGGTYRRCEENGGMPAIQPLGMETDSQSEAVAATRTGHTGPELSLSAALRERRSRRDHSGPAAELSDVAQVLARSAAGTLTGSGPHGDCFYRFPYPSGGSLGELCFIIIANRGTRDGEPLSGQIFEYSPTRSVLSELDADPAGVRYAVHTYSQISGIEKSRLQYIIVVLADVARVLAKYESVGPALILKHVGAWMQTMYLCAEDSDLGVCALGGGPGDLLARLLGETRAGGVTRAFPVGEMVIASRTSTG